MASATYSLRLRSGQREVSSIRMETGCGETLVGRSHRCALRTPEGDNSVSGVHARFFWNGGSLMVEDAGSRNGVFCHGSRVVKPQKVSSGDMFTIGGCSVLCERIGEPRSSKRGSEYHRLERLNGDKAGQQLDIATKPGEAPFTIGLDPGNSLCLPDMLVSRHHAELSVRENGECWLRDLGSKNGTFVNGEPLRSKERLLKDNDKVSVAYFDFRFLDRNVQHKRLFIWLKVFVVAATLCVMAGAYVMWVTAGPSVEECLRLSRQYAAELDFAGARKVLDTARLSREADRYRAQIDALDVQLELWEKTSSSWAGAKGLLAAGRIGEARRAIDQLVGGALDAWVWNGTSAVAEKRGAEFAARALRWYYDATDVLQAAGDGPPEQQGDAIRAKAEPLSRFMEESAAQFEAMPFLAALTNRIAGVLAKMAGIRDGFGRVDAAIAALDAANPDFAKLTSALDGVIADRSQHEAVRAYAEKYRQPCAELAAAKAFVADEFAAINALDFAKVKASADSLALPDKDLCARHPQLSEHRVKMEGHHADAQRLAVNLESMARGLAEKGVMNGSCEGHLRSALDEGAWRRALSFDCFGTKPPTARRKDPSCLYDALLGVEYTYQSLRALPDDYNGWCLRMIGFSPDVVEARSAMEYVDVFVKFVEERPKWLRRGRLGEFYKYCVSLQESRERIVRFLRSYEGERRAVLVTRLYAGYLKPAEFDLAARRALAADFKALQREVSDLAEKYGETSDPVAQIELRTKMLALGLPGDSQLHSKWVQKFEGGDR